MRKRRNTRAGCTHVVASRQREPDQREVATVAYAEQLHGADAAERRVARATDSDRDAFDDDRFTERDGVGRHDVDDGAVGDGALEVMER